MTDYIQNFRNSNQKWFNKNQRSYNDGASGAPGNRRHLNEKRKGYQYNADKNRHFCAEFPKGIYG